MEILMTTEVLVGNECNDGRHSIDMVDGHRPAETSWSPWGQDP